jgi:toxin ParE1/3/4
MEIIFATGVAEEVSESAAFYENEVEGLGKAFLNEVSDGIDDIRLNPCLYRIIHGDYRRYLISRFPFGIIYKVYGATIYIVAIMHLKRRPYYWKPRTVPLPNQTPLPTENKPGN